MANHTESCQCCHQECLSSVLSNPLEVIAHNVTPLCSFIRISLFHQVFCSVFPCIYVSSSVLLSAHLVCMCNMPQGDMSSCHLCIYTTIHLLFAFSHCINRLECFKYLWQLNCKPVYHFFIHSPTFSAE